MVCGTNLSGIGKAMLIYANDYEDELPKAGGKNPNWVRGALPNAGWIAANRAAAYSITGTGNPDSQANITSCFYLLVKYAEVTPKSFLCKGDSNVNEFKVKDYTNNTTKELIELWDFGDRPQKHCSYAYHLPFDQFAITTASDPGMAVAADPNPWVDGDGSPSGNEPLREGRDQIALGKYTSTVLAATPNTADVRLGNSTMHQDEGQNVLFLDSHVEFAKKPSVGINDDNIYTYWIGTATARQCGQTPANTIPASGVRGRQDSFLVNDGKNTCGQASGGGTGGGTGGR
jgi:hypothetical protein